ncbi:uncharacterized protein SPSK_08221 [Sporothrix schenckii 1099-18]|uniref:Uncharacterized protein n=1 Tax=Sporothrix schenckii 1099-18 TaxID=1397361 RepID=A0A0F2MH06_SPOSC|nr:uncharacterized protein SPSK_08221 [Sporothrix schenckii 1099-18]KJR88135.1 hypothetical protein SPSK_08221 [Sporothrix schenckii 1099-18]
MAPNVVALDLPRRCLINTDTLDENETHDSHDTHDTKRSNNAPSSSQARCYARRVPFWTVATHTRHSVQDPDKV